MPTRRSPEHAKAPLDPFSCDTSVVLRAATADGSVIFAKNSDRPPNECQPLHHVPGREHRPGTEVRCQYIAVPQVERTWEVIGSRPAWLWGFEMGVNEWGVAIGNEAVLTREPSADAALIGMDLVRLGLERATTAEAAVSIIAGLVERHGQGGSCEATRFRTYHNSFIVADPTTAWVTETAGRRWVAKRARDREAIGNLLTIDRGAYQDPTADLAPRACRLQRARQILAGRLGPIGVADMMALLRDHGDKGLPTGPHPLPTICMHANPSFPGETAAAMVVHLRPDRPREVAATVWTAFGSPCLSLFRPVYPFAVGLPAMLDHGGPAFDPESPWWVFERLQRRVARAPLLAPILRDGFATLEASFLKEAAAAEAAAARWLAKGRREDALRVLRELVASTTERSLAMGRQLDEELSDKGDEGDRSELAAFWQGVNAAAGLELDDASGRARAGRAPSTAIPDGAKPGLAKQAAAKA